MPVALSLAQTLFAVALAGVTLLITLFAAYVVSTVVWADRWFRHPRAGRPVVGRASIGRPDVRRSE